MSRPNRQKIDLASRKIDRAFASIKDMKYNEALKLLSEAEKAAEESGDPGTMYDAFFTKGSFLQALRLYLEALPYYEKAAGVGEEMLKNDPENLDSWVRAVAVSTNLGALHRQMGKQEKAREPFERALELMQKILEKEPENPGYQKQYGMILNNLGNLYTSFEEYDKAEKSLGKALETYGKLLIKEPGNSSYLYYFGTAYMNLGVMLEKTGRMEEAGVNMEKALEIREKLLEIEPENREYAKDLEVTREKLNKLKEEGAPEE